MTDMAFAKKVFMSYKYFYVENCGQTMEKVVPFNAKQKKEITYLRQVIENKYKDIKMKSTEIENKYKEIKSKVWRLLIGMGISKG